MTANQLMSKALDVLDAADGGEAMTMAELHRLIKSGELRAPLRIAAAAAFLEVSPHTLRYYERAGLVTVDRDSSGHRLYSTAAIERLAFVNWMRLSGMSMRDLRDYLGLADAGESTVPARVAILRRHHEGLTKRMQELQVSLAATEFKLDFYRAW